MARLSWTPIVGYGVAVRRGSTKLAVCYAPIWKRPGLITMRGDAVIDFHSFRAMRVTKAILSGKPSRLVMAAVRLSSESLLDRYSKISTAEINDLVNAVPMPNLLRVVAAG